MSNTQLEMKRLQELINDDLRTINFLREQLASIQTRVDSRRRLLDQVADAFNTGPSPQVSLIAPSGNDSEARKEAFRQVERHSGSGHGAEECRNRFLTWLRNQPYTAYRNEGGKQWLMGNDMLEATDAKTQFGKPVYDPVLPNPLP